MFKKYILAYLLVSLAVNSLAAQDTTIRKQQTDTLSKAATEDLDLFKMQDDEDATAKLKRKDYAAATFKTTRLINGHTIETLGKRVLDVKISHRFGRLNSGLYNLFGLDNASMRMGLDYGVTKNLMIGFGRSTYQKQLDGFLKYKLLSQSSGAQASPVSVSLVASIMMITDTISLRNYYGIDPKFKFRTTDKISYAYQVLIARKFSEGTSIQLMPTVLHYNLVSNTRFNDVFALGFGGRQKISKRVSINGEYYYLLSKYKLPNTYNSLSLGFDIETGGHVFQLHFTNSMGMTERTFIAQTEGRWSKRDVHFGFNIARVFTIRKSKRNR